MSIVMEMDIIQDEISRINAGTAQGDQSIMVQRDMKQWALKEGWWPATNYQDIVLGHAEARGWIQEGFTGMELADTPNPYEQCKRMYDTPSDGEFVEASDAPS